MDQAKNGIVMVSFGTVSNINQIFPNINNNLINVFKKFPKVYIEEHNNLHFIFYLQSISKAKYKIF